MSIVQIKRGVSALSPEVGGTAAATGSGSYRKQFSRFAQDTAGDVAILFGLMAMAMFMLIGAAVDLGRWLNARDQTISAIDAAVLAAGRTLQTGGSSTAAIDMARVYYAAAVKSRLVTKADNISFQVADNGTAVQALGNATIATPFMAVAGIYELPLLKNTGSEHSKSVLAVGKNAEINLEIAMMLDVSGSMGSNSKLSDMKEAANDLIDIVVWSDQSAYKSRVAVVPFSAAVIPPAKTASGGSFLTAITDPSWPMSRKIGNGKNAYTVTKTACVGERANGSLSADDLPGTGGWIKNTYTSGGSCAMDSGAKVIPLTSDKSALKAAINALDSGGGTAGHIGVEWTYFMLSPKWASLLADSAKPVAYGTAKTEKIAILMTDGEFNYGYDEDGLAQSMGGGNSNSSSGHAIAMCNQMKQSGITIYTVGFDLGNNATAKNTLKNCASDKSNAYTAEDGEELKGAFRDIALKVSNLYLTK